MSKEKISFIQPRHTYAPKEGLGHVYKPDSVLIPAARIMEAGGEVSAIQDLNLHPLEPARHANVIGVNLLGAPYIPEVEKQIGKMVAPDARLVLGGQVVSGLTESQRKKLFGPRFINGNDDTTLAATLGIKTKDLPSIYATSVVPAYEMIPDAEMKQYLSHEFSFFLSQGCRYNCSFCAVTQRTKEDPATEKITAAKEIYRRPDILEKDLGYLIEKAKKLDVAKLDIYLSNLDVFQTPQKLAEFAEIVNRLKNLHPGFALNMRGLSTVTSFLDAHRNKKYPDAIRKMKEAGLHTIGFGIDGGTPEIWKSIQKGHNTGDKCLRAIQVMRQEYGLTPEILMVFGHPQETEESLKAAVTFTEAMIEQYGVTPRPYVAKDVVPGNDYWMAPVNQKRIEFLLQHPQYFQALDYAALPSSISHPDQHMRILVEKYYRQIIEIPGTTTKLIYPISPESNGEEILHLNEGGYDN